MNQELETYLRMFSSNQPEGWSELLPMAEFTYNSATHSIMNKTLFSLMMGYEPRAYPSIGKTFLPNLEERLSELSHAREDAIAAHRIAQQKMKEQISSKFKPWKEGDRVWLEMTNLCMNRPRKLLMKRTGPFEIEKVISKTAYHLQIPQNWKIHPIFHASLLTPYEETVEHGPNFLRPPLDLVDRDEEYEVEAILRHHGKPGRHTFLVRWKGYSPAEDTWDPERNLYNADDLIREYKIA